MSRFVFLTSQYFRYLTAKRVWNPLAPPLLISPGIMLMENFELSPSCPSDSQIKNIYSLALRTPWGVCIFHHFEIWICFRKHIFIRFEVFQFVSFFQNELSMMNFIQLPIQVSNIQKRKRNFLVKIESEKFFFQKSTTRILLQILITTVHFSIFLRLKQELLY